MSTTFLRTCLVLVACAACSKGGATTRAEPAASRQSATTTTTRRDRNVITREELADPSVAGRNVLEVVRSLRPQFLTVRGTHTLQDTATARRVDQDAGKVLASIDGTKIVSVDELAGISATSVVEIRFLTPAQAMQRFGGAAREGPVILVTTN
jgi:hypothetical protein